MPRGLAALCAFADFHRAVAFPPCHRVLIYQPTPGVFSSAFFLPEWARSRAKSAVAWSGEEAAGSRVRIGACGATPTGEGSSGRTKGNDLAGKRTADSERAGKPQRAASSAIPATKSAPEGVSAGWARRAHRARAT